MKQQATTTLQKADALLKIIDIADSIANDSANIDAATKEAIIRNSQWLKASVEEKVTQGSIGAAEVAYLIGLFLIYWNESIGVSTELFWRKIDESKLGYQRKDPLRKALDKGRFTNVHQGMEARKHWDELLKTNLLNRFTTDDMQKLQAIIAADEQSRMQLLSKCLAKNEIPQSKYLRFGDSMAYFVRCNLFGKYFTQQEVDKLYDIWGGFQAK